MPHDPTIRRRELLKAGGGLAAAGLFLGCGAAADTGASGTGDAGPAAEESEPAVDADDNGPVADAGVDAGPVADYPDGTTRDFADERFIVLADAAGFWAVSTSCTHRGAALDYDAEQGFVCPWHGAVFTADGSRVKGPARKDLPCYRVRIADGRLRVDTNVPVPVGTKTPRPSS